MTAPARLATRSWVDHPGGSGGPGSGATRAGGPGAQGGAGEAGDGAGDPRATTGPAPALATGGEPGAPLALLVHGVTSSSRTWWRVAPELARRGYRVLAVDLRGHGASIAVGGVMALGDLTADVLETLGPPSPSIDLLLGHSLGALVALDLLGTMPGIARRLVLEDPPGQTTSDWTATAESIEIDGRKVKADPVAMRRELESANPGWGAEEVDRRLADLTDCDAEGLAAALRGAPAIDLNALASVVRVPTLVLAGTEELGSALAVLDRKALVDALDSRGSLEMLEAGHSLHREAFPSYMEALGRWLDATQGREGP